MICDLMKVMMMTMTNNSERIAVIGGGSWGTALANRLAVNGHDVLTVGLRAGTG